MNAASGAPKQGKPAPWRKRPRISAISWALAVVLLGGTGGLIYVVQYDPRFFSEVPQIVYQLFLTVIGILAGWKFSADFAQQREAEKWVNEAADAVDELLTLDTNILTRRAERQPTAELFSLEYSGQVKQDLLDRVAVTLRSRCDDCRLFETSTRKHLEKHARTWQQFIELSCGGSACEYFTQRVELGLQALRTAEANAKAANGAAKQELP